MELFSMYYTFLITILQRQGHILSIMRHLQYQWPWISLSGHLRSLILAPIESAYITSYWISIVTSVLSCRVSKILATCSIPLPYSGHNFRVFPWRRSRLLESVENEDLKLTNGEIIFEEFQPDVSFVI